MQNPIIQLISEDSYLKPYEDHILRRINGYNTAVKDIISVYKNIACFADIHNYLGIHRQQDGCIVYREWAPAARGLYLTGDFNNWDRKTHPLHKIENGVWEIVLDSDSSRRMTHGSCVKVHVHTSRGDRDRIPACIRRVIQDPSNFNFSGQFWEPESPFYWTDSGFTPDSNAPFIYESHVGMATEAMRVSTYAEFATLILPRIKQAGYNAVQLMGIMEHPYYGSFGYHVSNFFAPSSRFGTPEELKELINTAHEMKIAVYMDIVHSHAVKNLDEGLNLFDGTQYQYFHDGGKGIHDLWDSMLFDYGKTEVRRFLLSNIRYWIEEFHFDGFRFDGITSMLYRHHGNYTAFTNYDFYFCDDVEQDTLQYLQLANTLAHSLKPYCVTIAEDVSGMPGLCRPPDIGGLGFDFRLGMGIPDYWIKILKEQKDEDWDLSELYYQLTNRRQFEKTIAYCESHDQALVGDKTIAFRLMDQEMYWHMHKSHSHPVIDRGIALHKLIRLVTIAGGGEGWLNFMGNEFGHPEWIDFPREGNGHSHKYARRQWSLPDNPDLRYAGLQAFDREMISCIKSANLLSVSHCHLFNHDYEKKIICFIRGNLVFVFSFNSSGCFANYRIGVPEPGLWRIQLCSDDARFGGFNRIDSVMDYMSSPVQMHGYAQSITIYITNRTAIIFKKKT